MTIYLTLKVKSLLTNKHLIFWSIVFIEFWVIMWFFVFSSGTFINLPLELVNELISANTATAFAYLGMLCTGTIAISFVYTIIHQLFAIRFLTKFTKLSSRRYIIEDTLASLIVYLIVMTILYLSILVSAYIKYGKLIMPTNPLGLFGILVLSALVMHLLAYILSLAAFATGHARSVHYISYIPLMLAFTAYAALWTDFGKVGPIIAYANPFHALASLIWYTYFGQAPPVGKYFTYIFEKHFAETSITLVNPGIALASAIAWIVILSILSVVLVKRIRPVPPQEILAA